MSHDNIFQERAEKLTREEILQWFSLTSKDEYIMRKLLSNSTKLLIGPRGSGKSMLMRLTYYHCIDGEDIFPIYVNFEKYLNLEPLLHKSSNGNIMFVKWVLAKIIYSCITSLCDINQYAETEFDKAINHDFNLTIRELQQIVFRYEGDTVIDYDEVDIDEWNQFSISVGGVVEFVSQLAKINGRKRVVLLLDDAAHAFSENLQREFFEVFRVLKSKEVSAKAAVYPGLTAYSPYFNVGHDALFLETRYAPDEDGYIDFCNDLLRRRFGDELFARLAENEDGLQTLYFAANGIPRGLIVMTEFLIEETGEGKIYAKDYYQAIDTWVDVVEKFHTSLKGRLPRYANFIDSGIEFMEIVLNSLKDFNKNKVPERKAVYFALSTPVPTELDKMVNILEYAGLITQRDDISKGSKGVFTRYLVHIGKIVQANALIEGTSKNLSYTNKCLQHTKSKQFKRIQSDGVFGDHLQTKCSFVLPPCPKCNKPRIAEDVKFCAYCGAELTSASILYEIWEQSIDILPLTAKRIRSIREESKIRTIKDVLMDDNGVELKKVRGISTKWAQKIRAYADEFIGG